MGTTALRGAAERRPLRNLAIGRQYPATPVPGQCALLCERQARNEYRVSSATTGKNLMPIPIHTPRLLIREFAPGDEADVHEYASDPEVVRFMPWAPNTPDQRRQFLDRRLAPHP